MATISEALALASGHHQAGRLDAAERIYRQILAVQPDHAEVLHRLGLIAHQAGRHAIAVDYISRAIALSAAVPAFHSNLGEVYRALGNISEAVACYRRALRFNPDHVGALNNLGNALYNQGRLDEAVSCFRRALELQPNHAAAHNNLGNALSDLGKLDEAVACYHRALELQPDFAEAHNNLGSARHDQGQPDDALACVRRALQLQPDYAEAHNNLGDLLREQGKPDEAALCFRRAVELKPDFLAAHNNLSTALRELGELEEAMACCRRALQLQPDYAPAHNNLGVILKDLGRLDDAVACYHRALQIKPHDHQAHNNLGVALREQEKLDEAVACYRRAIQLQPDFAEGYNNLGGALKAQAVLDEAVACYRRALELKPGFVLAHSNLVYAQLFRAGSGIEDEGLGITDWGLEIGNALTSSLPNPQSPSPKPDAQALLAEHRRWQQQHAAPLAHLIRPHGNDRSPQRRLRIGYISPDFRDHCQALFTTPLFSAHDHQQFEIVCYSDVVRPDAVTQRLRSTADLWRSIVGLSHEQVAELIRSDGIDILVDLTMHMAGNRLLVLARKPAPVQVCWLAYPGTTGLLAVDYRLTDPHLDPPEGDVRHYSEQSIRLPDTFWCYDPLDDQPAINDLPATATGCVTFGCLNNFCKVNGPVLRLWAQVLRAVARSRLVILASEGTHRQRTLDVLAAEGVACERVTFLSLRPRRQYLEYYHGIDVGLDTVPYNGHTTSLDSLWMGVPVVTLVGPTVVGRAGLSISSNAGLPELVAHDVDEYVAIATELAGDLPRLAALRSSMRQRLQGSPLMDAPRFARGVEAAYRQMWLRWCETTEKR